MAVITDPAAIDRLLSHHVVDLIGGDELRAQLLAGKPLRIKLGADPTAPDLHLGHAVVLHKLRAFQDLGHTAVLIVGDYTALIGDPSGRSKTRPVLSEEEVIANAKTYLSQVFRILREDRTEVRHNSEWLSRLGFADMVKLAGKFTVARIIERDDFANRLKEGVDVSMHELLYPIAQAYDSVMVEADVEIGGSDQRFNVLAGRELQKKSDMPAQSVMIMGPLLVGTDGVKKMSKSLGNGIGLTDAPTDMYGKLMSVPDTVLVNYFTLTTTLPAPDVAAIAAGLADGSLHPRDAKMRLAREVVTLYHSAADAANAEANFVATFQRHEAPADMPELRMPAGATSVIDVLIAAGLVASKSEARRLIEEGGVRANDEVVAGIEATVMLRAEPVVIQKGKRHFVKVYGE
jgi:tyrosyl-tRNA synthetase